ncbi:MAG: CotH kinase family protein [Lachnospiraceae bacterium]|nr:CotH kinase family protein [Lachnospiraceae bacterium]
MKKKLQIIAIVIFSLILLASCREKQTAKPAPTEKPAITITATWEPTATLEPTATPEPTKVIERQKNVHVHNWRTATCKEPMICMECGMTELATAEHIWQENAYIEPTCADGKIIYTCACESIKEEWIEAIGSHVCNENGTCIECGNRLDVTKMILEEILIENVAGIERCGVFTSEESKFKIYKPIVTEDVSLPIVELDGDLSGVTKYKEGMVGFSYEDSKTEFSCFAKIHVQGASSVRYPKKNYSIKLVDEDGKKNKVELVNGWGKQHKYCMKANYIDFSQARNVVSGKLWGDVVASRGNSDELSGLINGGAIDGYPVLVYHNGDYLGLYTMNIPKDKWLFGMKDSEEKTQAMLMAIDRTEETALRKTIKSISGSGMELEYYSNEESKTDSSAAWVKNSFNEMVSFVINNDGEEFLNGISRYADVEKCIDSMLYTYIICAADNLSKNILWVTFDGTVWYSSVYDMDGTWGLRWDGSVAFKENNYIITKTKSNLLWEKLYKYDFERIAERYWELREGPLSMENITEKFDAFFSGIPQMAYDAEKKKWPDVLSKKSNTKKQILDFAIRRLEVFDEVFQR